MRSHWLGGVLERRGGAAKVLAIATSLLAVVACEGVLDTGNPDVDGGGDDTCDPICPAGSLCREGQCVRQDDSCLGVTCSPGSYCDRGSCVFDDPCADVTCSNPGDACQGGVCVSGAADNDLDGYPARDDCDDYNPDVHPGLPDMCNGVDEDCDEATGDGDAECPGFCCGAPAACGDCCEGGDCGLGDWQCTSGLCECSGVICDGTCHSGGDCCSASDCGTGEWTCDSNQCNCPGTISY